MYSSRYVFMLLVLLVVLHCSDAKRDSRRSHKKGSAKSSTKSGSTSAECSVCPRLCSYTSSYCLTQFEIPAASQTDIFIGEEFDLPIYKDALLALCQAACDTNDECKEAIVKFVYSSTSLKDGTCILSKLTAEEIATTVDDTVVTPCNFAEEPADESFVYFPLTVEACT